MKISVLGNLIDTENIYQITPIVFTKYDDRDWCEGSWIETEESECEKAKFKIKFFNSNSLIIEIDCYKDKDAEIQKIKTLRDVVIGYWSNNQSNIPKVEFI
jgi:hypothetical protein